MSATDSTVIDDISLNDDGTLLDSLSDQLGEVDETVSKAKLVIPREFIGEYAGHECADVSTDAFELDKDLLVQLAKHERT